MHNMKNVKFLNHANISTLKFWTTQILMSRQKYIDPLCILLFRNIPLRGNSVWIFLYLQINLNFITMFWSFDSSFSWNILTTLYLKFEMSTHAHITYTRLQTVYKFSWHDMKLELTFGVLFDKWSWSVVFTTWSRDFF